MERRTWILFGVACVVTGCAGPPKARLQAPNGAVVLLSDGRPASVPFAPAGTPFEVRLDQAVDSRFNFPGQQITATLVQPIQASDGSVLVPSGTQILGRIAAIDRTNGLQISLDFDALRIQGRAAPIGTRVLSAQQTHYRALPSGTGVTSMQAPGGEPQAATDQLSMPAGGVVQLALTRPLIQGRGLR